MLPKKLYGLIKKAKLDINKIKKAYVFAEKAHLGQKRKSGEPYIIHPVWIAERLCELESDTDTVIAALLHDTVEDTSVTQKQVNEIFGKEVGNMVKGLTKFSKLRYRDNIKERAIDSFLRMTLSSTKDLRVVFIKLIDRLHNMSTIKHVAKEKQIRIARETLEIFVPLANLLGAWSVMIPLEDYCLEVLYPKKFKKLRTFFTKKNNERGKTLDEAIGFLNTEMKKRKLKVKIQKFSRRKHSIIEKADKYNVDVSDIELYDGIEIITETKDDCYKLLGLIHSLWSPRFNKMKDYIARPKANGYTAFHTSTVLQKSFLCDFRIMTNGMKARSKLGLFHSMKEKKSFLEIIDEILILQENVNNKMNFYERLKDNVLQKRIYVLTTTGDVVSLAKYACPIDVAYKTKGKDGQYCYKAKVNGAKVSLNYMLEDGDVVEVIYNRKSRPQSKWLKWVKSSLARKEVTKYILSTTEDQSYKVGRKHLEKMLFRFMGDKIKDIKQKVDEAFLSNFKVTTLKELIIAIGHESVSPKEVLCKLFEESDLMFSSASLRHPQTEGKHYIEIVIEGDDRVGALNSIIEAIAGNGINIMGNSSSVSNDIFTSKFIVLVKSFDQFYALCEVLEELDSISKIYKI